MTAIIQYKRRFTYCMRFIFSTAIDHPAQGIPIKICGDVDIKLIVHGLNFLFPPWTINRWAFYRSVASTFILVEGNRAADQSHNGRIQHALSAGRSGSTGCWPGR
jgi:hypothetical protein